MCTFGHFSDIHFQFSNYDTANMREKLLKKLSELPKLDYIFITGDIFYRGDSSDSAEKEVKEYIINMAQASRCEIENVFICAGNHDLKRSRVRAANLKDIIEIYNESNGNHLETADYSSVIYNNICFPFNHICQRITGISDPEKIHRFIQLRDFNLILLNTSVFAGQTYPGQKNADGKLEDTNLFICDEKFLELKDEIKDSLFDDKPIICLGHHSPDCFEHEEKKRLVDFLDSIHCDLYLCGHIHTVSTNLIEHTDATYRITCGGPFKDDAAYNTPSFIMGKYDPQTHEINLRLFHYGNSWELYNQAYKPWKAGEWNRKIDRLKETVTTFYVTGKEQKDHESILESELQAKYLQYILKQSSEIGLDGLPTQQEDASRFYKLNQIFIPEHFEKIGLEEKTYDSEGFFRPNLFTDHNNFVIYDLLPSDDSFKNLILSDPGSGKTTLIKWIVFACCSQEAHSEEEKYIKGLNLFPIWIRCRDIKGETPTIWESILDITRLAEWYPSSESIKQFKILIEKHLIAGNALLLIDGLDEIDNEKKRKDFISQIEKFMGEYPNANAVVTSRWKGYRITEDKAFSDFSQWSIQPLSSEDISSLCKKWYYLVYGTNKEIEKKADDLAKRIYTNTRLRKLASNPLMLTTLLLVERRVGNLPNKRAGLYFQTINVLLESWNRGVHEEMIDLDEAKYQLAFVAFHMMTDKPGKRENRTQITQTGLQKLLRTVHKDFGNLVHDREPIAKFLDKVEQKSAILYKIGITYANDGHEEPLYSFQHLTFEEYLAAYAVTEDCYPGASEENRDGKILFNSLINPEMREVIALASAIKPRCAANISEEIIRQLREEKKSRDNIYSLRNLLLQLIADEVSISPVIVKEAFDVLFKFCIYGNDHSYLALILTGKYGNDLREFFRQTDDTRHQGINSWSTIPILLTDGAFNPVEYYLQHCSVENPTEIANALSVLAKGCWIRGKKVFNGIASLKLEIIRRDIQERLRSKETGILQSILSVIYFCVPGIWDMWNDFSDYYSALAYYINQTSIIPDFLEFSKYAKEYYQSVPISPAVKLTNESINILLNYLKESTPWDKIYFQEALTIALFATISCEDEQGHYITQIYNLIIEMFCENENRWNSIMREFISFVGDANDNQTLIALPEKIRASFNHFYEEAVSMIKVQYTTNTIFDKHDTGGEQPNLDIDELIKKIDQKIAELEREA